MMQSDTMSIAVDEGFIVSLDNVDKTERRKYDCFMPRGFVLFAAFVVASVVVWKENVKGTTAFPSTTGRDIRRLTMTVDSITTAVATDDEEDEDGIDWSDTIFTRWESDNDPFVVESHKLIFFTIPKNSCTEWKKIFRRIKGYPDWKTVQPHHPDTNGLTYLGSYSREKQREFMTSPEWTRAIFVREPMERLLSAYLNKGLSEERYVKKFCCGIRPQEDDEGRLIELQRLEQEKEQCVPLVPWETQPTRDTFTFETFVDNFMNQCNDKHWRPQSKRMNPKNWKFLNFIGRFDDLHGDAKRLLERVGAWEEYGSNGWGEFGNLSMFEKQRTGVSNTHSRDHLLEFYNPRVAKKVLEYLEGDYTNPWLNFSIPSYAKDLEV
jgi:hypothetical protein